MKQNRKMVEIMKKGDNVLIKYPTMNKLAMFIESKNDIYYFQDISGMFGVSEKYKRENNVTFEIIKEF